jgi:protein-disulfide isomerase
MAKRSRNLMVSLSVLGVLLVVVVGVVVVQMVATGELKVVAPQGAVAAEGVPLGTPRFAIPRGDRSAPVTLTIYEDYQCPACRATEAYLRPTIDRLVENSSVRVEYHPIAFLDAASTTDYSSRALAAAACVLDQAGDDAYLRMHDLLYLNQPPEGSAGLSDDQLADLAQQAGANRAAVADCMDRGTFAGWVQAATEQASKDGVNATPTVLANGTEVTFTHDEDPRDTLEQAVQAAS